MPHTSVATNAFRRTAEHHFDNGYGASVVAQNATRKLFELAVLGPNGDITYDTTGPNGVYQYLTAEQVEQLLDRIAELPAAR